MDAELNHSTRFQLVVRPLVKATVGQRDASGQELADAVVTGATFSDIIHRLWEMYKDRMRARAIRTDGGWSSETPTLNEWPRMMQLKLNRHIVDAARTEQAWNLWLARARGRTVQLVIYEYGTTVSTQSQLDAFLDACIRPQQVDSAGAAAEVSLREIVHRLQAHWAGTFQAEAVVWRMWAKHITRNLNRATWEDMIAQPPPDYVAHLLRMVDNQLEEQLTGITRSANLALECVQASIIDHEQLRSDWQAMGRRLDDYERSLATRKSVIEAFIRDMLPPSRDQVVDPHERLINVEDHDHAE